MPPLSSPHFDYGRHRAGFDQFVVDGVVPDDLSDHAGQKRHPGNGIGSQAGHWLQRGIAHEAQADQAMHEREAHNALEDH